MQEKLTVAKGGFQFKTIGLHLETEHEYIVFPGQPLLFFPFSWHRCAEFLLCTKHLGRQGPTRQALGLAAGAKSQGEQARLWEVALLSQPHCGTFGYSVFSLDPGFFPKCKRACILCSLLIQIWHFSHWLQTKKKLQMPSNESTWLSSGSIPQKSERLTRKAFRKTSSEIVTMEV